MVSAVDDNADLRPSLRARIRAGESLVSTMISEVRNPAVMRILASAGLDSCIIDMEHGAFDWESVASLLAVARGTRLEPVVRISEVRRETVMKPLDAGAAGILVPMVERPQDAEEVVAWAKYPPAGIRGAALRRGHTDYLKPDAAPYLLDADERVFLMMQIESVLALENVEAIASVDGVDALFLGPFDMSLSMGIPGQVWSPQVLEALTKVTAAAKAHGKAVGIQSFDLDRSVEVLQSGVQYLSHSTDVSMLIETASAFQKELRNSLGHFAGQREGH